MIRVADYIIQRLVEAGIDTTFLITGRGILYLSDAIAKNEQIQPICVHHEQAAAFAAVGYAQQTNKLGCCVVSTGCASTNTLTGVLNAWQDGVPLVVISGQNKLNETVAYTGKNIRTYGSQEANLIPIVTPITKYATTLLHAEQIAEVMDRALWEATHGVRGPVWIDVPVDVQNMRVEPESLTRWNSDKLSMEAPIDTINDIVDSLNVAERPVLLIGNGIRSAHAVDVLRQWMQKYTIPVVFSASAVDIYGTSNKYSVGTVGTIGCNRAANITIQNADLILSIGCRLSPTLTGSEYAKFAREAKMIVVDIDEVEHSKNTVRIDQFVHADALDFIQKISIYDIRPISTAWLDKVLHWKTIFPKVEDNFTQIEQIDLYEIAGTLSSLLPNNAVVLTDAGMEELLIPTTIDFRTDQRMLHPASQGCMGVALPASIGAYYACQHDVIVVVGDGSIMMNIQELQTISSYNIPVKIIVVNNGIYAVIRKRQKELFRTRTIGTDTTNGVSVPSFENLSNSFNIPYYRIESKDDLAAGLEYILSINGPVLCEIIATENQDYIRSGATFNSQRKFVNRPIEDQMPFLDREIIKKEMIIEPIDM